MENYEGFELQYPCIETTVREAELKFPHLTRMMIKYYQSSCGISGERKEELVSQNGGTVLWNRLEKDKVANESTFVYRSFKQQDVNRKGRIACYFAGCLQSETNGVLDCSYGSAHAFVEHRIESNVHILLVAAWVTHGLRCDEEKQVFAKKRRSRAGLFCTSSKSVRCMSHTVSVIESDVPNCANGLP